jgi:Zn-dependent protease with chaperone function
VPPSKASQRRAGRGRADLAERQRRAREAQDQALQASREVLDRAAVRRDESWRAAAAANRRRCITVLWPPVALGLALMALGAVALPLVAIGGALAVAWGVLAASAWRRAHAPSPLVEGVAPRDAVATGALSELAAARFEDVAESLCLVLGLKVPELRVLVDPAPNALSTGAPPGAVRIVATSGLLELLERIELEAVLAHELSHVKRLDTLSGGLSLALVGGGSLPVPGSARIASFLEGPGREVEADLAAVLTTRYPPALVSSLERLVAASGATSVASLPERARSATARLWLAPLDAGRLPPACSLAERIEVLLEL